MVAVDDTLRGLPELTPFVHVDGSLVRIHAVVDDLGDRHAVSVLEWEVALFAGVLAGHQLDRRRACGIDEIDGDVRDRRGGAPISLSRHIRTVFRHAVRPGEPLDAVVWAGEATARATALGFERVDARVLEPLRQALMLIVYAREPYEPIARALAPGGIDELLGLNSSELEGSYVEFRDTETGAPVAIRSVAVRAGSARTAPMVWTGR